LHGNPFPRQENPSSTLPPAERAIGASAEQVAESAGCWKTSFGLFRAAIDDLPACRSSSENLKELKYLSDYEHRTGEGERQFDLVAMHTRTRSG